MIVGLLCRDTISLMRCAKCGDIMSQGERESAPRANQTHRYRAVHQACVDAMTPEEVDAYGVGVFVARAGRLPSPM